jgi:hypothetical protein
MATWAVILIACVSFVLVVSVVLASVVGVYLGFKLRALVVAVDPITNVAKSLASTLDRIEVASNRQWQSTGVLYQAVTQFSKGLLGAIPKPRVAESFQPTDELGVGGEDAILKKAEEELAASIARQGNRLGGE